MHEEAADEGDLLQNVLLHTRNGIQEEDGEDAGHDAKAAGKGGTTSKSVLDQSIYIVTERRLDGVGSGRRGAIGRKHTVGRRCLS